MKTKLKDKYKFTIQTKITPEVYRNFAKFDTFMVRKRWVFPVVVCSVLLVIAAMFFAAHMNLLAVTSAAFALVYAVAFFNTFSRIMRDNTHNAPRGAVIDDYLVSLTDEGVEIYSEEEQATCTWEELHAAYLLSDCIALYLKKDKSFLITEPSKKRFASIWDYVCQCAGSKARDRRSSVS